MIVFVAAPPMLGLVVGVLAIELILDWAVRERWLWDATGGPNGVSSVAGRLRFVVWVLAGMELAWAFLNWVCRRYVLTERRAILIFGVLHQRVVDLPLGQLQNVGLSKPLLPRLVGLGHVGLASAGTDGYEIVWRFLARPDRLTRVVREAADASKERA